MRKFFVGLGAMTLIATLAACSGSQTPSAAPGGESAPPAGSSDITISIVVKGKNTYWALAESGARQAGTDLGVNVNFNAPDTENEPDKQLNMLTTAINNKSSGIGFSPQDGAQASAPEILDQAQAAGIPVVIFDNPLSEPTDVPLTTLSSDNKGMGAQLAEQLTELIGGKGKVALVTNGLTGNGGIRRDGFVEWVEANAPDVEVVDVQNGEADQALSADKAQGILQAHPDLAGLAGTGVDATVAIGDMINQLGHSAIGVGIDASPDTLTQIEEGRLAGVVTQNPYQMGYSTVEMLVDAIKGGPAPEKTIVSESVWVNKDNMNTPEGKTVLGTEAGPAAPARRRPRRRRHGAPVTGPPTRRASPDSIEFRNRAAATTCIRSDPSDTHIVRSGRPARTDQRCRGSGAVPQGQRCSGVA